MLKDSKYSSLLLFFIYSLFLVLFSYFYISNDDKMYPANIVLSNFMYIEFFDSILKNGDNLFSSIFNYTCNSSYNPIHILLLFPFYLIFGSCSRFGYVLGIQLFYIIPLIFVLLYLVYKKLVDYNSQNTILNVFILSSLLFNTALSFAALRGYADIVTFIPFFLLVVFFIDFKFEEKQNFLKIILFSIVFYFIFLLRRCYIILDFTLFSTLFLFSLIRIISNSKILSKKEILTKFSFLSINLFLIPAFIFCLLMFIFQKNYIINSLSLKLDVFQAYQATSLFLNFVDFISMVGYFVFVIFCLLFIPTLFIKDSKKNNFLFIFSLIIFYLLPFLSYTVINNYGFFFVLSFQLLLIYVLDKITLFFSSINKKIIANILVFIVLIFNCFNFVTYVTPQSFDNMNAIKTLINKFEQKNLLSKTVEGIPSKPYKYHYFDIFNEVYSILQSEIKNNPSANITTYAFIDDVIGFYILKNYSIFNDGVLYKHLLPTAEYFNFEGIAPINLDADYVLVTNPIRQVNIEESFLPLYFAGYDFLESSNLSKSYECIYSVKHSFHRPEMFEFFEIHIYKKIKPVTPIQVENFYNSILEKDENLKDLYSKYVRDYTSYFSEKYTKH